VNWGKLARFLIHTLAALSVTAAFAILDWYPTVKDLGRLRRERGDWERKIRDYGAMAAELEFPDAAENELLGQMDFRVHQTLPPVDDDAGWKAVALTSLQQRVFLDGIPHARLLFGHMTDAPELGSAGPGGGDPLVGWIGRQFVAIQEGFLQACDPERLYWRGLLGGLPSLHGQPANRPVCVVAMAPLPALLGFINHVSWDESRLEIVRLHLEPDIPHSRAWMVCRITGWMRNGALTPGEKGESEGLRVDQDSPLLLRRVEPLHPRDSGKRDLPEDGSPW
jgi:hypothetical protein